MSFPPENYLASKLYNVSGMVALVTGGGSGIGLMIAQGLASNGAKIYITGRRKEVLESRSGPFGESGGEIIPLQMDATDKASISAARDHIESTEHKLDILINNAGQSGPVSPFIHARKSHLTAQSLGDALFANESFEEWSANLSINVSSIFFLSTAFFGLLEKGARARGEGISSNIVNITSVSGLMKIAQDHFCYNAGKAAAAHLTKMMATELMLRRIPIRVNAIAPGVYGSEMTTSEPIITREATDAIGKPLISIPAERAGTEYEIAAAVIYLVSHGGGFTNGQEIVIDGGHTAVNPSTR